MFDTETPMREDDPTWISTELTLTLGVAKVYDPLLPREWNPGYVRFTREQDFHALIEEMPKHREKIWLFAHNAGFDLRTTGLITKIVADEWTLWPPGRGPGTKGFREPKLVIESPPTIVRFYRADGQEFLLCDTFQWISMALWKIGKNLKFEKGKDPGDRAVGDERWDYCQRDVDVLDLAMRRVWSWLKGQGFPFFCTTRAGQAMKIFQMKYEDGRIFRPDDPSVLFLDRHAYYGGQTEVYRQGLIEGPVYQIDVNSLYPAIMASKEYPVAVRDFDHDDPPRREPPLKRLYACTAEVYLNSPDRGYPTKCREGTYFLRGKVRTVLSGAELERAYLMGHIDHFGRWTEYRLADLFSGFIAKFWRDRQDAQRVGDTMTDSIVKLLMNSLYGKFGQRSIPWKFMDEGGDGSDIHEGIACMGDPWDDPKVRNIGGKIWYALKRGEGKDSFIPIATFVTANARDHMYHLRSIAGHDQVYYQATDSLYVSQRGYDRLVDAGVIRGDELGYFKLEDVYDSIEIFNIHNMNKGDKQVRGSVKGKSPEVAPFIYRVTKWEELAPALKRGHHRSVHLTRLYKALSETYIRQRVGEGGWCVPWWVENWETTPEIQRRSAIVVSGTDREEYPRALERRRRDIQRKRAKRREISALELDGGQGEGLGALIL